MGSILTDVRCVKGSQVIFEAFQAAIVGLELQMVQRVNSWLEESVDYLLGREHHVRRSQVGSWLEQSGYCVRCGSRRSYHFSRNGTRPRMISFMNFTLALRLPRVVCECGGSVKLDFGGLLQPYQRLGGDVEKQIHRWAALRLSLRQMQQELSHFQIGSLGLRALMTRLHELTRLTPEIDPRRVPPVIQIDAIWITQMRPNGRVRRDSKGRKRAVKGRVKRPILIAMGVWPEQENAPAEILAWHLGENESSATWLTFLSQLEEQGLRGANGLQLIIHDGGSGLCAALEMVDFGALDQRCLFHKLRNIARAIELPPGLSVKVRSRRRRAILRKVRSIWEAKRYATVLRRYLRVVRLLRKNQPRAVKTLQRDFRATLAYYQIEQKFPGWDRKHLRTTSRLERFNRVLRQRTRSAGAYQSDNGVLSMGAQQADQFCHLS